MEQKETMELEQNNGRESEYQVSEVYEGLRNLWLNGSAPPFSEKQDGKVYGILMEWPHNESFVTLVALQDGTVSLYFSNGGGINVAAHVTMMRSKGAYSSQPK